MPILRYFGHSACEVVHGDTNLLIDPFLTGNPLSPVSQDTLNPTAILITHAHNDHMGDSLRIAKNTGAQIVAIHEIATWFSQHSLPAHGMSIGGGFHFPWGWVKMTPAWHGSTYLDEQDNFCTLGTPGGFLLKLGSSTLYHAGDTALFSDMALIGRRHPIDLALLPIGDNYTMGPDDAVEAAKLLNAKVVVPIHYNTFPVIQQDPHGYACRVKSETSSDCLVLEPGQTLEY
jgi:L-ascorbate metabolism protein UlaG (beta-lactamase superfamily)